MALSLAGTPNEELMADGTRRSLHVNPALRESVLRDW